MTRFRAPLLFLATILLTVLPPAEAKKKQETKGNTIENLFRPLRMRNVHISPDGKWAAGLAPINGIDREIGLVVIDLDTMKIKRSFRWKAGFDIYRFGWLNADSIAFSVGQWKVFTAGVYRLDVEKGTSVPLIGNDAAAEIIDPNAEDDSSAWIWLKDVWEMKPCLARINKRGTAVQTNGFDKSIAQTKDSTIIRERISQPPGDVFWWYVDNAHEPRIVDRYYDNKREYLHRDGRDDDWKPLPLDPDEWDIKLFSKDNRSIYVAGYKGEDTKGLYLYDIDSNTFSDVLFRDSYYDFSSTAQFLTIHNALVGIQYQKDIPTVVWLAPELEAIQKMVDQTLPKTTNVIYDWSDDFRRLIIGSYSDTVPPVFAMLDLKTKELKEISKSAPWLETDSLSQTEVFHFNTSDGLRLEGYLNRPTTGKAPYPTVCYVHGGPWVRDDGAYDATVQYLTSQGYAVMKVNYRGSSGYGKKISEDPEYDFRRMHDDVTEAVQMAVKAGVADPKRLAIMGASFGGYAALCGAAFEPDLYRCSIPIMGVFDWEEMTKDRKRQSRDRSHTAARISHDELVEAFGDPNSDENKFEEVSPINYVDQIKIPIFVVHGKNDRNVSIRQSKDLVAALKKAGVEHEVMFLGGEGHNYFNLKHSVELYNRIKEFLDANMKSPSNETASR